MSSHNAAYIPAPKANLTIEPAQRQSPGSGEALVKNLAIALNPVEFKIQKFAIFPLEYPAILGSSFAGTVEEVGSNVSRLKKGDRVVVGKAFGPDTAAPKYGVYQQYVIGKEAMIAKIEDPTSFEDAAATVSNLATVVGALTLAIGLEKPSLTSPASSKGKKLLVYGGSSSVGGLAIQYATQAGYAVVTTSSPRNRSAVEPLGATKTIDHTQPADQLIEALKAEGPYDYIFDTISLPPTTDLLAKFLETQGGGVFYTVQPAMGPENLPAGVERKFFSYPTLLEEPQNSELLRWFYNEYLPKALAQGKIIPTKVEKIPGGLEALQGSLDRFAAGQVSGVKLVVNPWDT